MTRNKDHNAFKKGACIVCNTLAMGEWISHLRYTVLV